MAKAMNRIAFDREYNQINFDQENDARHTHSKTNYSNKDFK